jgi:high-affinity nickel permease
MPDAEVLTMLGLGFVLGLRHALDTDHIVAVSTVLAQQPSVRASGIIGVSWGLGHTLVLLLVGTVVLALRVEIPESLALAAEFGVGVMLVLLGSALAVKLSKQRWHLHAHEHDGERHLHLHSHQLIADHHHPHWLRDSIQPLCIGMAHGLAGSAALLLVVLSTAKSMMAGMLYITVFGVGSILGMILIGLAISVPVLWSLSVGRRVFLAVQGVASLGSIGLGVAIMLRIVLHNHLS